MGRPTKYRPEYAQQVENLCLLGLTDKEIADSLGVSESTINKWKTEFSEFSESIKKGKTFADGAVAGALYNRALGYSHPEDDIRSVGGEIVITPTIKHYPPDTGAAIFWLKNRQQAKWRDKPPEAIEDDVMPASVKVTVKDGRKS